MHRVIITTYPTLVTGYLGSLCEDRILSDESCTGVTCMNGGTCVGLTGRQFYCSCLPAFVGERCELGMINVTVAYLFNNQIIITHTPTSTLRGKTLPPLLYNTSVNSLSNYDHLLCLIHGLPSRGLLNGFLC